MKRWLTLGTWIGATFTNNDERAMVLALEGARRSEFAGQHPGRKRQAGQNSDATPLGFPEEQFAGPLAKNVEYNLHRLHARKFDGLQGLLHFLDAHSIMAYFA